MNWYKLSQSNTFYGYKIVGVDGSNRVYSIYDKSTIDVQVGKIYRYSGAGLYLGTSERFCMDYYSCGTPDEDGELLLTYQYESGDIIKGEPSHPNGEIQVRQAKLVGIKKINKEELC